MKPYYEHNGITIYHGDARDVLPTIAPARFVLVTDPPYGVNLGTHAGAKDTRARELKRGAYASYEDSVENYREVVVPVVKAALEICVRGAVFGVAPAIWSLPPADVIGGVYIPAATGRNQWGFQSLAPVLLYGIAPDLQLGARATVKRSTGRAEPEIGHPCPKPQDWLDWLVGIASREDEVILDPFAGSGTTLRAAKDLRRRAIGIEIEEQYCEIAAGRLAQEVLNFQEAI